MSGTMKGATLALVAILAYLAFVSYIALVMGPREYAELQQKCWAQGKGQAYMSRWGSGCYDLPIKD